MVAQPNSHQLQLEITALTKELMVGARRVVNMYHRLSKDKCRDAIVIKAFEDSLKADPSNKGQLEAFDIIISVSYFDEAIGVIEA